MTNNRRITQLYKMSMFLAIWKWGLYATVAVMVVLVVVNFTLCNMKMYYSLVAVIASIECVIGAMFSYKLEHSMYFDRDKECSEQDISVEITDIIEMLKKAKANHEFMQESLRGKLKNEERVRYAKNICTYMDKHYNRMLYEFWQLEESLKKSAENISVEQYEDAIYEFLNMHWAYITSYMKIFGKGSPEVLLVEIFYNDIEQRCMKLMAG